MKKYGKLIEGVGLGVAGLVISHLGWVDESLKSIRIALSVAVVIASFALFFFQNSRDKSRDTTE